jgi:hypothetical protein
MKRMTVATIGLWTSVLVAVICFGCEKQESSRLNAPPQGVTDRPHELQEPYVFMVDNAMLGDMNMSSVHFVPHQAELNSLGVRRLKRFASLLDIYGGTLRYDGAEADPQLRAARMQKLSEFLVDAGIKKDRFNVAEALAGGRGMAGSEALLIRVSTRYDPKAKEAKGLGQWTLKQQ